MRKMKNRGEFFMVSDKNHSEPVMGKALVVEHKCVGRSKNGYWFLFDL